MSKDKEKINMYHDTMREYRTRTIGVIRDKFGLNKWTINLKIISFIQALVLLAKNATIILSLTLSGLVTIQLLDYRHDILSDNLSMEITPYSYAIMTYFVASLVAFITMYIIRENVLERHGMLKLKTWNEWINR